MILAGVPFQRPQHALLDAVQLYEAPEVHHSFSTCDREEKELIHEIIHDKDVK